MGDNYRSLGEIVYNIPVGLVAAYRGRKVIVRAHNAADLVNTLSDASLDNLVAVNLLSLTTDVDPLAAWGHGLPVEIVMCHPQNQFPLLYRHAKLLDKHPVRVSITAVPGFSKAVKLAASLRFVVKLEPGQPDPDVVGEMSELVDFYLHQRSISQPIEFFHSAILDFYHGTSTSMWEIQEEDPAYIRYVTDDGVETVNRRPGRTIFADEMDGFVSRLQDQLFTERAECSGCEFFKNCGGYFKWPCRDYACVGVRTLFRSLRLAADDLRSDLALSEARAEARL